MSVMPTDRRAAETNVHDLPASASLSHALATLPLFDPPSDGWLRLRASIEKGGFPSTQSNHANTRLTGLPPRPWRSPWRVQRGHRLLAVAAALALAALLLGVPDDWKSLPALPINTALVNPVGTAPDVAEHVLPGATSDENSQTETLMAESARLQSLLGFTAASGRDAETLAIELALVDRMQWIDYLLADPNATAATREVLWQQRVELLTQRLALGQRDSLIAASDAATREVTL